MLVPKIVLTVKEKREIGMMNHDWDLSILDDKGLSQEKWENVLNDNGVSYAGLEEAYEMNRAVDIAESKLIHTANGEVAWFVGVYESDKSFGGPEEGGWWFETGELFQTFVAPNKEDAEELREKLKEIYPYTGMRSSMANGDDWDVVIFRGEMPIPHFPEEYPHYE